MKVTTEWFNDQFNIHLFGSAEEPFLTIRGCRIVNGKNGEFVSYPYTKNEKTGKYWNHAKGSDGFNATVLQMAQQSQPKTQQAKVPTVSDLEKDIPF